MLSTLRIKNLALVTDLTLQLQPGYNVITGETGAGKSIIIGALNLLLGERADRTLLRAGCDSCAVEAVFDLSKDRAVPVNFFEENGLEPCVEDQLILKRCAYWLCLKGWPAAQNETRVRVSIPRTNRFSVESLAQIMEHRRQGDDL